MGSVFQVFVRAQKSKAYFKRYQVKFKRRRGIVLHLECLFLYFHMFGSYGFNFSKCLQRERQTIGPGSA